MVDNESLLIEKQEELKKLFNKRNWLFTYKKRIKRLRKKIKELHKLLGHKKPKKKKYRKNFVVKFGKNLYGYGNYKDGFQRIAREDRNKF